MIICVVNGCVTSLLVNYLLWHLQYLHDTGPGYVCMCYERQNTQFSALLYLTCYVCYSFIRNSKLLFVIFFSPCTLFVFCTVLKTWLVRNKTHKSIIRSARVPSIQTLNTRMFKCRVTLYNSEQTAAQVFWMAQFEHQILCPASLPNPSDAVRTLDER